MKSYSEALSDIEFLLHSDDTNAIVYFYKGIVNRNRGEIIDAIKNYDIALKILSGNNTLDLDKEILETKRYFYSEKKKLKERKTKVSASSAKKTSKGSAKHEKIAEKNIDLEESKEFIDDKSNNVEENIIDNNNPDNNTSASEIKVEDNFIEKVSQETFAEEKPENVLSSQETLSQNEESVQSVVSSPIEQIEEQKQENVNTNIFAGSENVTYEPVMEPAFVQTVKEKEEVPVQKTEEIQVPKEPEQDPFTNISQLDKLIKEDKTNSLYYQKRGDLYLEQLRFKDAVKDYDMAIKYNKNVGPEVYKNKSRALGGIRKYKDAIQCLGNIINSDFVDADIYFERALLYQEIKDYKNYLKDIESAIDYDPSFNRAYMSRIDYYVKQSKFLEAYNDIKQVSDFELKIDNKFLLATVCFHLKKYYEVISLLTSIYEAKKQEKETDFYLGVSFAETGDYDSAIKYLTRAMGKGYKNKLVFYMLAKSCYSKQNLKESLDFLNRAINMDSSDYKCYWLRAKTYGDLNNVKLSIQDFDKATKLNSKDKELFLDKIGFLEKNDKISEAISNCSKLIQIDGKNGEYYLKRALLYKKLGKNKDAEKDFSQAETLGTDVKQYMSAENNVAEETKVQPEVQQDIQHDVVQEEKQDMQQDVKQETKSNIEQPKKEVVVEHKAEPVINVNIDDIGKNSEIAKEDRKINVSASMIHLNRGNISFRKQKYEEAISELDQAISFNYKDSQGYLLRAEAYIEIKKYDSAIKDLLTVIELSPKATFAYSKIGDIYRVNSNFEQAKAFYTKAIEINPKYALAYFGLAEVYEKSQEIGLAIEKYKEAAKLDVKLAKECNMKIAELNS